MRPHRWQVPPSLGFSRQERWSGLPFPSPMLKVKSESEVTQLCLTLRDPVDCSLPGSSIHGILQARVLEWVAIAFSDSLAEATSILFSFYYFFILIFLLYNTLLVLPYINMNLPRVYISSHSWTSLPLSSPYHPSGLSQCTNPKHPVSCIEPRLAIRYLYDIIHVSMPFS